MAKIISYYEQRIKDGNLMLVLKWIEDSDHTTGAIIKPIAELTPEEQALLDAFLANPTQASIDYQSYLASQGITMEINDPKRVAKNL